MVHDAPSGTVPPGVEVAVVSPRAATEAFPCPIVVCSARPALRVPLAAGAVLRGILPRSTLTPQQLMATVRAAAAGLHVGVHGGDAGEPARLDHRSLEILRLLADGAGTREIATSLSYSERTIKALIREIEVELGVRSRAQAVAEGIRQGLI